MTAQVPGDISIGADLLTGDMIMQVATSGPRGVQTTLFDLASYVQSSVLGLVTPMLFGAVGDGTTDDHDALQRAADSGYIVFLDRIYANGSRIMWSRDGGGFISNGAGGIALLTGPGQFDEASASPVYASNTVAIQVEGYDNVQFDNFRLYLAGTPAENNTCWGIVIRHSMGHSIQRLNAYGFKATSMIVADACRGGAIRNNHLHDCVLTGTRNKQATGISVDSNIDPGWGYSRDIDISDNYIHDLTVDATFLAANGYQTDGITIEKAGSSHLTIERNRIYNVGEGIDCFGSRNTINGNNFYACFNFALKFPHGASWNIGRGNLADYCGLAAVTIVGSAAPGDVSHDNDIEVLATRINPLVDADSPWAGLVPIGTGPWDSGSPVGALNVGGPTYNYDNIIRITVSDSENARGAISNSGGGNTFMYGVSGTFLTGITTEAPAGDRFINNYPSQVRANRTTTQTVPSSVATTIVFNDEVLDLNGEYDPATGIFTANANKTVSVSANLRCGAGAVAGNLWTLTIHAGSGQTVQAPRPVPTNGEFGASIDAAILYLARGDQVYIQLETDKGSDQDITGSGTVTNLMIKEI